MRRGQFRAIGIALVACSAVGYASRPQHSSALTVGGAIREAQQKRHRVSALPMPAPGRSPKTDMDLTVTCTASYDSLSALYTYSYTIENSAHSGSALKVFGIYPMKYQTLIESPDHWTGFDRWQEKLDAVVWRVYDNVGTHPTDSTAYYELPQSPYCVAPGQSLSGFVLVSRQPPGTVTWYAQAYDTLASIEADPTEGIIPNANTLFQLNVSGTTQGPNIQSPVGVESAVTPGLQLAVGASPPHPATGDVHLWYSLDRANRVSLAVYDVMGRRVAQLEHGVRPAGRHALVWDGRTDRGTRVASGTFFVRLSDASGRTASTRLTLVR
jgi:hypothetical protein